MDGMGKDWSMIVGPPSHPQRHPAAPPMDTIQLQ